MMRGRFPYLYAMLRALIVLMLLTPAILPAQEPETIRVKRESDLVKAVFDPDSRRLTIIDRFGNPRDNKVISYRLYVKSGEKTEVFPGFTNELTPDMVRYLNKQKKAVKIFFSDIRATDDNGHIVTLPTVIDHWFPDCSNCEPSNRGRR